MTNKIRNKGLKIVERREGELTHIPVNLLHPVFVVLQQGSVLHTGRKPFCSDPSCPCHHDKEANQRIQEYLDSGKISAAEGMLVVVGLIALREELQLW